MATNATASPAPESASQRRSGRVVRVPTRFEPDLAAQNASKRKRDAGDGDDGADNDAPDLDDDMSDVDDESDADEDDAPRSRRKKPSQSARSKKPALKKPKTNGTHLALSVRPKKAVRIARVDSDGNQLYGT